MAEDGVYDQVEDIGGKGVSLRGPLIPLEGAPTVPAGLLYHSQLVTVRPKRSDRPGTDPKGLVPSPGLRRCKPSLTTLSMVW